MYKANTLEEHELRFRKIESGLKSNSLLGSLICTPEARCFFFCELEASIRWFFCLPHTGSLSPRGAMSHTKTFLLQSTPKNHWFATQPHYITFHNSFSSCLQLNNRKSFCLFYFFSFFKLMLQALVIFIFQHSMIPFIRKSRGY